MCESRDGDRGPYPTPGYRIHYQCWSETPEKITNNSMLDHHRPASETPFKWPFNDGPMMAHFKWYLDPLSPHQLNKLPGLDPH